MTPHDAVIIPKNIRLHAAIVRDWGRSRRTTVQPREKTHWSDIKECGLFRYFFSRLSKALHDRMARREGAIETGVDLHREGER